MTAAQGDQSDPSLGFPFADRRRCKTSVARRDGARHHAKATRDGEEHELVGSSVTSSASASSARMVVRRARAAARDGSLSPASDPRANAHGMLDGRRADDDAPCAPRPIDESAGTPMSVPVQAITRGRSYALDRSSESPTRAGQQHSHQPRLRRHLCRACGVGPVLRIPRQA